VNYFLPSTCSNLPDLREFGQHAFVYGNPNDPIDMHSAVIEVLESREQLIGEHERIERIARMEECGRRLVRLLKRVARGIPTLEVEEKYIKLRSVARVIVS